jgi:uncharacterized protein
MDDKQPDRPASPWWRHPMMWLIVGGPLTVVVAALVTATIAIRGADTVLPTQDTAQSGSEAPAIQARNHAATQQPAPKP